MCVFYRLWRSLCIVRVIFLIYSLMDYWSGGNGSCSLALGLL